MIYPPFIKVTTTDREEPGGGSLPPGTADQHRSPVTSRSPLLHTGVRIRIRTSFLMPFPPVRS
ncbi:MAG TPA: hypothetical protein PK272_06230 [Methanoregulaceae archaeon]|nr:hypothetical protein [Burkholderiaceae bacterium]NLH25257.1 hypothetical protein [Methanomicrobiales archaeon]HNI42253.1 hypothetical protein [Methanoregulaceae archaeon]HNL86992.1 hypothetical protein [Methanoregulaceae archaeon]HNO07615.1 hypothetical protein [Methanoregulaceae archaeon]